MDKNMNRGIVALTFRCDLLDGHLRITSETAAAEWLTPDQIRDRMSEAYTIRLLDALSDGPPATRAHDGVSVAVPR